MSNYEPSSRVQPASASTEERRNALTFEQAYYTSTTRGLSGRSGQQFVAASAGLDPDALRDIEPFMGYERPASFGRPGGVAVAALPVILGHHVSLAGRHLLTCSRHAPPDHSGRMNSFTHVLVTQEECPYGIELWNGFAWASEPGTSPKLDPVKVARGGPDRLDLLRPLLEEHRLRRVGAIVQTMLWASQELRSLILVDSDPAGIVAWITLLSYLLTPEDACKLSFITYARDLRRGQSLRIIGATDRTDLEVSDRDLRDKYTLVDLANDDDFKVENSCAREVQHVLESEGIEAVVAFHNRFARVRGSWPTEAGIATWRENALLLGKTPPLSALECGRAALISGIELWRDVRRFLDSFVKAGQRDTAAWAAWQYYAIACASEIGNSQAIATWIIENIADQLPPADLPTIDEHQISNEVTSLFRERVADMASADSSALLRLYAVGATLAVPLPDIPGDLSLDIGHLFTRGAEAGALVERLLRSGYAENRELARHLLEAALVDVSEGRLEGTIVAGGTGAFPRIQQVLQQIGQTSGNPEVRRAAREIYSAVSVQKGLISADQAIVWPLELAHDSEQVASCLATVLGRRFLSLDDAVSLLPVLSKMPRPWPDQVFRQVRDVIESTSGGETTSLRARLASVVLDGVRLDVVPVPWGFSRNEYEAHLIEVSYGSSGWTLSDRDAAIVAREIFRSPHSESFVRLLLRVALGDDGRPSETAFRQLQEVLVAQGSRGLEGVQTVTRCASAVMDGMSAAEFAKSMRRISGWFPVIPAPALWEWALVPTAARMSREKLSEVEKALGAESVDLWAELKEGVKKGRRNTGAKPPKSWAFKPKGR